MQYLLRRDRQQKSKNLPDYQDCLDIQLVLVNQLNPNKKHSLLENKK